MLKKIFGIALLALGLVGAAVFAHGGGFGLKEGQDEVQWQNHFEFMNAMHTGDYEAAEALADEGYGPPGMQEGQFELMVQMHEAMSEGNYEEASQIREQMHEGFEFGGKGISPRGMRGMMGGFAKGGVECLMHAQN